MSWIYFGILAYISGICYVLVSVGLGLRLGLGLGFLGGVGEILLACDMFEWLFIRFSHLLRHLI